MQAQQQPPASGVFWDTSNPAGYGNRSGAYKTRVEHEFLRRHIPAPPARVLDIAGGSGRFATRLLQDGYDVTVNDIDPRSLQLLDQRCRERKARLVAGDFLQVELQGPFDCALAIECLTRMPFEPALARARQLLKPGGMFVFTVLNSASWRFAARRVLGRAPEAEHVMNTRLCQDACDRAGFEVVGQRGLMWTPFTVSSNSRLVPLFSALEEQLRLYSLYSQSPWLLVAARRRG